MPWVVSTRHPKLAGCDVRCWVAVKVQGVGTLMGQGFGNDSGATRCCKMIVVVFNF
ncbi:hypothetical protein C8Q80DRAFT_1205360 [Daedaleopsis nitida]|nr:hypothetical protein C8Q80DRAFT_1205360 [Daedaleopsis nitida]